MDRLKGKRALLTACGAGIGRATALLFAAEGAHVIATDLKPELMADLKDHGVAETHALNVRDSDAVRALAATVGPVDVLFNCAGFVHHGTVLTTSEDDWDFSFDLNVKSMHRTIQCLPAGHAGTGRRLDRQYRVGRLVGPRHSQPLCLWRLEGGGDRPDQGGGGRFHPPGRALQRDLPRHHPVAVARRAHRRTGAGRRASRRRRSARPSSTASRWGASARRRRSPGWRSISPPTNPAIATGQIHLVDGGFAL